MEKIYIAGKVSGEPYEETKLKFKKAQETIEKLGYEAVNPLEVVGTPDIDWEDAMKLCIKSLMDCRYLVALDDWKKSTGAKLEVKLCKKVGIVIYDFEELEKFIARK